MPSLKIRPKKISMHGRQEVRDYNGRTLFSVGKLSRIKTMSLRHNLGVCLGDSSDEVWLQTFILVPDLSAIPGLLAILLDARSPTHCSELLSANVAALLCGDGLHDDLPQRGSCNKRGGQSCRSTSLRRT
jgi:hypothetical protein